MVALSAADVTSARERETKALQLLTYWQLSLVYYQINQQFNKTNKCRVYEKMPESQCLICHLNTLTTLLRHSHAAMFSCA